MAAAVTGYFGSLAFATLAETSRTTRRRILERFREEHGDRSIATPAREHVERMVNAKVATPGTALNFLVALRGLMRHAINVGLRVDDPTAGVRGPKFRSAGFYTWTEEDIATFEGAHPIGTRARLAFALFLYTAQRRADKSSWGVNICAMAYCTSAKARPGSRWLSRYIQSCARHWTPHGPNT